MCVSVCVSVNRQQDSDPGTEKAHPSSSAACEGSLRDLQCKPPPPRMLLAAGGAGSLRLGPLDTSVLWPFPECFHLAARATLLIELAVGRLRRVLRRQRPSRPPGRAGPLHLTGSWIH